MAAILPNPPPELPQDFNDPAPDDTQEQPLTREELEALIGFFTLLDTWDKKKKTRERRNVLDNARSVILLS
jgi:hypothetical protein